MSAAHTPGPWLIRKAKDGGLDIGIVVQSTSDRTPGVLAEVFYDIYAVSDGDSEMLANAALIASAPELLAFAQSLANSWRSQEGMPNPYVIAAAAQAVIAKATGGAA